MRCAAASDESPSWMRPERGEPRQDAVTLTDRGAVCRDLVVLLPLGVRDLLLKVAQFDPLVGRLLGVLRLELLAHLRLQRRHLALQILDLSGQPVAGRHLLLSRRRDPRNAGAAGAVLLAEHRSVGGLVQLRRGVQPSLQIDDGRVLEDVGVRHGVREVVLQHLDLLGHVRQLLVPAVVLQLGVEVVLLLRRNDLDLGADLGTEDGQGERGRDDRADENGEQHPGQGHRQRAPVGLQARRGDDQPAVEIEDHQAPGQSAEDGERHPEVQRHVQGIGRRHCRDRGGGSRTAPMATCLVRSLGASCSTVRLAPATVSSWLRDRPPVEPAKT